jgi:hypothetical protein
MEAPQNHTAGSLLEQTANMEMRIAAARRVHGSGHEATGIGGRKMIAWSPRFEAVFDIIERAINSVLNPGTPEDLDRVTEFVGRRAVFTRDAVRDTEVMPLRHQSSEAINKAIAMGVARLEVRNAVVVCQAIVRRVYEEVEHLRMRIEAAITHALAPARLLDRLDETIRESDAPLAVFTLALRRLEGRAQAEPARIDQDLADSAAAVLAAEERLRVIAHETTRTRMFGVERAVGQVVREVQVTVPKLTDETLSQMYLPKFRDRIVDIARVLTDRAGQTEERQLAIRDLQRQLRARRRDELARLSGRGRVQLMGAPASESERRAEVDRVVDTVYSGVARELRDLLVWKAAQDCLLDECVALVQNRVDAVVPARSIDAVVLSRDADPRKVALMIDEVIQSCEVSVALEAGADRTFMREWCCRVIRLPSGAKIAQALIQYAGYRDDEFDFSGPPDCLEVIVLQPGISLRATRLFRGGASAYRDERGDPAAPPVETFADAFLRTLTRRRSAVSRRNGSAEPADAKSRSHGTPNGTETGTEQKAPR